MDNKILMHSSNSRFTRLSYIENALNMSEKLLLSKLNTTNSSDQNDMLEFLHNNNSTIHSSNLKIIQGHLLNNKDCFSYDNVFDKTLDNYIMQYSLFPFNHVDSNEEKEINLNVKERKVNHPKSLKIHRAIKIEMYLERKKNYFKNKKHQRGLSCFSCFGQRINFNQQQNSPSTSKDNKSIQVIVDKDNQNDLTNNIQPINTDHTPLQNLTIINPGSTPLVMNSGNSNPTYLNLKENSIHASVTSNNNTNIFPISTKAITFILTSDIVKSILMMSKASNEEYIIHSYTYLFDKNAFVNDLYFYELKLRTNIEKILQSKNIKYPLVLNGNVFIPQVVFFRGDEEVNFKVLDSPIVSPMIVSQLIPDTFINKVNDIQILNKTIIEEALNLSDNLDYETILVNLLPIAEINQIFCIIKNYIELFNNNKLINSNSVNFLLNMNTNQFQSYVNTSGIPQLLEKANIKTTIITL